VAKAKGLLKEQRSWMREVCSFLQNKCWNRYANSMLARKINFFPFVIIKQNLFIEIKSLFVARDNNSGHFNLQYNHTNFLKTAL